MKKRILFLATLALILFATFSTATFGQHDGYWMPSNQPLQLMTVQDTTIEGWLILLYPEPQGKLEYIWEFYKSDNEDTRISYCYNKELILVRSSFMLRGSYIDPFEPVEPPVEFWRTGWVPKPKKP